MPDLGTRGKVLSAKVGTGICANMGYYFGPFVISMTHFFAKFGV